MQSVPAVGFAVGLERMAMMLPDNAVIHNPGDVTVYVAGFGDRGSSAGLFALEELRQNGIRAVSDFRSSTLKAHLRQADRLRCRFTLILGDDEVLKGSGVLRNMQTKVQTDLPLTALTSAIQPLVSAL
jgi:histidyl-tRNA synthetase